MSRFLTREVGIGSSSQDAELHFWIIADNSSSDISLNSLKHVPLDLFSICELFELFSPEKVRQSVQIFSLKGSSNHLRDLALMVGWQCIRFLLTQERVGNLKKFI